MRAVRFWMAAFATGAVAPKPRPATPSVTDDAGIGDELVILTPEGAACVADMARAPEAPEALAYDALYPACAGGCGDLVDRRGESCYRCAGAEARRLDLAARRDPVGSR